MKQFTSVQDVRSIVFVCTGSQQRKQTITIVKCSPHSRTWLPDTQLISCLRLISANHNQWPRISADTTFKSRLVSCYSSFMKIFPQDHMHYRCSDIGHFFETGQEKQDIKAQVPQVQSINTTPIYHVLSHLTPHPGSTLNPSLKNHTIINLHLFE